MSQSAVVQCDYYNNDINLFEWNNLIKNYYYNITYIDHFTYYIFSIMCVPRCEIIINVVIIIINKEKSEQ